MKQSSLLPLLAAVALSLPACTTYYDQYHIGAEDYVLARRTAAGGLVESYHLDVRSSVGDASLRVVSEYERERPFLGLQPLELDAEAAAKRGVRPFAGILLRGVYPQSAAAAAGVLAGDVLLSLDGQAMVYLAQLADFEAGLAVDQAVSARILRGQSELDLELRPKLLRERVHDSQDIELERVPTTERPLAGVGVRGIPPVWCEKIFGHPCNAVIVTTVEVGSPAWLAGIRGGDVVEAVDGAPVPPAAELMARLREQGPGTVTRWRVRRGSDATHEASIALDDYSGESHVWIPLVFRLENGVYADRWSAGPFGLVASNRNHYLADTSLRTVQTRNVFSALLGLFRVESGPRETEVRLLWFIRFDT
jgi:hypothetical protein